MDASPKVIVTGGTGVIGSVLQKGLEGCDITPLGKGDVDIRNYADLLHAFEGKDIAIHLALNPNRDVVRENFRSGMYDPDNSLMTFNVYKAALEAKVKRVIMASSVHADNFYEYKGEGKLSAERMPTPDSPYGANKLFMEFLGRYYATQGLEVICIRFGGVNPANIQPDEYWEHNVWLSHDDCVAMMKACIQTPTVPDNFAVFYAVSNNEERVHDTSNPFGWSPQ